MKKIVAKMGKRVLGKDALNCFQSLLQMTVNAFDSVIIVKEKKMETKY